MVHGSLLSSMAGMTATAVFFPPLTRTSPSKAFPPVISIRSFMGMISGKGRNHLLRVNGAGNRRCDCNSYIIHIAKRKNKRRRHSHAAQRCVF